MSPPRRRPSRPVPLAPPSLRSSGLRAEGRCPTLTMGQMAIRMRRPRRAEVRAIASSTFPELNDDRFRQLSAHPSRKARSAIGGEAP